MSKVAEPHLLKSGLFKSLALFVTIGCGVWLAVLWRWEATARDMNSRDIVVYLGVLPLTLFVLTLLLRWAWRRVEQPKPSAAKAIHASTPAPANATALRDDAQRCATVQLLAAHISCVAGTSAAELQAAVQAGTPRPVLDPELRDEDGLPVFAARIADLDMAATLSLLEPHLASTRAKRPERAEFAVADHVQRALAALHEPLASAAATLTPRPERIQTASDALPGRPIEPRECVRVVLGWPADWTPFEQELGSAFATELIARHGAPIPAACFAVTSHSGSGEALLLHAHHLLLPSTHERQAERLIVAACYSAISEAAIEALERDGLLFSSRKKPKGRMPGEAAVALVLASAGWPADPDADGPPPHLHRPAVLRRDKSIDSSGRVNGEIALQAMTQALAASGLRAAAVAAIVCDADQHTARGAELHGSAVALLSHLDGGEDLSLIGTVSGAVDVVSALLVVACAAERATALDEPCLAVTLGDRFARLALVALPGPPPKPDRCAPASPFLNDSR